MKKKNWYPLDNAAKIFPAVYSEKRPYNFCFSAILTENVNVEKLNKAINNILDRVPTFKTKLKRGLFWYYLERNKKSFIAQEEPADYLSLIDFAENNDYLFKVYYRERKISIVSFHALSDGNGVLYVFKEILLEYAVLCGKKVDTEGKIKTAEAPETYEEINDNYVSNYKKTKIKSKRIKNIAHSDGTPFEYDGFALLTLSAEVEQFKSISKQYNATITEYLAGLYLYDFFVTYIKNKNVKDKTVVLLVPVNMRKKHVSQSVRNYSLFVRVVHDFSNEISLEECIETAKEQIKKGSKQEVLDAINAANVRLEKNILMKITPLFLKDFAMKIVYHFVGENYQSGDLSNVGVVDLPECLKKFVQDMYFSISASHTSKQLLGVLSYNGKINLTFTRNFVENDFERFFIKELTDNGIKLTVQSNYWEKKL